MRLVVYPTSRDEAEEIAQRIAEQSRAGRRPREFAIFYRVNWLSRALETALRSAGVPYQVVHGLEFYQRKEVKDVLAYLHLINNPRNEVAFLRVINTPPRKIGKTTVRRLGDRPGAGLLAAGCGPASGARAIAAQAGRRARGGVRGRLRSFVPVRGVAAGGTDRARDRGDRLSPDGCATQPTRKRRSGGEHRGTAERGPRIRRKSSRGQSAGDIPRAGSLVSDTDDLEAGGERVSLMTLHAAKGLEFPAVYIVAMEQGLLPHERSREDPAQLEEERRLLFVGITRCREQLS